MCIRRPEQVWKEGGGGSLFDCFLAGALGPVVLAQAPQDCEHEPLEPVGQDLGLQAPAKQTNQPFLLDHFLQLHGAGG